MNSIDEDLVSFIVRSFVEEGEMEQAAISFLSIPQEQRKVYSAAIRFSLTNKVEDWEILVRELMCMEEIPDTQHPPSDLYYWITAFVHDLESRNSLLLAGKEELAHV